MFYITNRLPKEGKKEEKRRKEGREGGRRKERKVLYKEDSFLRTKS